MGRGGCVANALQCIASIDALFWTVCTNSDRNSKKRKIGRKKRVEKMVISGSKAHAGSQKHCKEQQHNSNTTVRCSILAECMLWISSWKIYMQYRIKISNNTQRNAIYSKDRRRARTLSLSPPLSLLRYFYCFAKRAGVVHEKCLLYRRLHPKWEKIYCDSHVGYAIARAAINVHIHRCMLV